MGVKRHALGLLSLLLFPLYVAQGLSVRARQVRLPSASLPRRHRAGDGSGEERPLTLLLIGDSSVAGVGVERLEDGLAAALARDLSGRLGRAVEAVAYGNNSATTADLLHAVLPHIQHETPDLVVMVIGVNDVKNFRTLSAFGRDFGRLCYALNARFPGAVIAHTTMPDMGIFPVLPAGLRFVLNLRRQLLDDRAARLCAERGVRRLPTGKAITPAWFAKDRFHMNADGYRWWAQGLGAAILADGLVAQAAPIEARPTA